MTPVQRQALDFISGYIARNRYSPTLDEMAVALGVKSRSSIHRIVNALIDRGYLVSDGPHKARGLRLPAKRCPHCGNEVP